MKPIHTPTNHGGSTLVKQFRFIRLVRDLSRLRSFYEDIFDWPIKHEWDAGVMYDTGSAIFELMEDDEADNPSESSQVSIFVPDVRSLFECVKDRVTIVFPLRDNSWGDTSFQISDPDGFLITFFTPTK